MNRWYHLINNFGVETNLGTPASEGTDVFSSTYYGKGQGFIISRSYKKRMCYTKSLDVISLLLSFNLPPDLRDFPSFYINFHFRFGMIKDKRSDRRIGLWIPDKEMRHKGNGQDYSDQGQGFFKPPLTGYYSPVVSTCDDYCSFQISAVGDVGCPADLRTHGFSDHHSTSLLGRTVYTSTYHTQEKLFLDASEQYYVNFHHFEGGGEDWAEFGFIFHGTDPDENMDHGGFTKGKFSKCY